MALDANTVEEGAAAETATDDAASDADTAHLDATVVDANTFDEGATAESASDDAANDGAAAQLVASLDADLDADWSSCVTGPRSLGARDASALSVDVDSSSCVTDPSGYRLCCNSATQYYEFYYPPVNDPVIASCVDFGCAVVDCRASHTCECIGDCRHVATCNQCSEDDAGHVVQFIGPCYGAPPARLERLVAAAGRQRPGGVS
jgi:hypothetical protein